MNKHWSSITDLRHEVSACLGSEGTDEIAATVSKAVWLLCDVDNKGARMPKTAWDSLDLWEVLK